MRRSEVCRHTHLQDREREGRARAKGSGSKVREVGNRKQKKLESLITDTKAKIDKDTEAHFFGKTHPLGHLEESVCGSCQGA